VQVICHLIKTLDFEIDNGSSLIGNMWFDFFIIIMFLYVHVLNYAYNMHLCIALMLTVHIVIHVFISNYVDFKNWTQANLRYECIIDKYSEK